MAWQDWIDTTKAKARERIVSVLFALITLLLIVVWQAVPSSTWNRVSEATPKRALWALLGLAGITIGLLTAFVLDNRRKRKNTPLEEPQKSVRRFGVHWDSDFNPLCPVCEVLLHISYIEGTSHEFLRCPKCKADYTLRNDEGEQFLLYDVKRYLNGTTPELQ